MTIMINEEAEEIVVDHRKDKRQKRIQQKSNHINKQVKIAKSAGIRVDEPHRYAKHNALDCGVPQCPVCNGHQAKRQLTIQEKKVMASMDDSERE
jgi:hypothetical protein